MTSTDQETIQEPPDDPDVPKQYHGLNVAAFGVGLADHKWMLAHNRRSVERAWQMGLDALGWKPSAEQIAAVEDDMAGDVNVAGDTHNHVHLEVHPDQKAEQPKPEPAKPANGKSSWLPWALAAMLAGGQAAGLGYWLAQPTNPIDTDTDTTTTIELSTGKPQ